MQKEANLWSGLRMSMPVHAETVHSQRKVGAMLWFLLVLGTCAVMGAMVGSGC